MFGTATTKIPARLAAFTPLGESSKTIAASFGTLSRSQRREEQVRVGLGPARPHILRRDDLVEVVEDANPSGVESTQARGELEAMASLSPSRFASFK